MSLCSNNKSSKAIARHNVSGAISTSWLPFHRLVSVIYTEVEIYIYVVDSGMLLFIMIGERYRLMYVVC